jgi:hypothetical protein
LGYVDEDRAGGQLSSERVRRHDRPLPLTLPRAYPHSHEPFVFLCSVRSSVSVWHMRCALADSAARMAEDRRSASLDKNVLE